MFTDVIIVAPSAVEAVESRGEILAQDLIHIPTGERCPHMTRIDGMFACDIHDREFYKETPCYRHSQIETEDSPCRMGQALAEGKLEKVQARLDGIIPDKKSF